MTLKTMDPDTIRDLIKGQPDVLTAAAESDARLYNEAVCPSCGNQGCHKLMDPPRVVPGPDGGPMVVSSPFGNAPLPHGHAKCPSCETEFDPTTGVIRSSPPFMIHEPH